MSERSTKAENSSTIRPMPDTARLLSAGALLLCACSPPSCARPHESSNPKTSASERQPAADPGAAAQHGLEGGHGSSTHHASASTKHGVFVSEFHYDNVGKDRGEAVEVEGPASTALTGYQLFFYNGQDGEVYRRIDLEGLTSSEPGGRGTLVLRLPTNGIQNGSPDGISLVDPKGKVVEFLSYEGTFTARTGPAKGLRSADIGASQPGDTPPGSSLQRYGSGAGRKWRLAPSSFGRVNALAPPEEMALGECGHPTTAIAQVQGAEASTPLLGQHVVLEGVVVGDFQDDATELGGFFLQSLEPDADPKTSEGLFVDDQGLPSPVDVRRGERVRVAGTASEKGKMTQLSADALVRCGAAVLPAPAPLPLPFSDPAQLEAVEGMLVSARDLTVTDTYNLGRFGELSLSIFGRLFHANNGPASSSAANVARHIILDDGRRRENAEPVAYLGEDGTLRLGDTLPELTAVVHQAYGHYRLQPVQRAEVRFSRTHPRSARPARVGGQLRVATLNVLNYFTQLNKRGADNLLELARQRSKLVSALIALDADVVGLVELENNERSTGRPRALDDLVASLNAELETEIYARAPDPAETGRDAIRTAIIYKTKTLRAHATAWSDGHSAHSRRPISATFSAGGEVFSVVVSHFKSKGGCPKSPADPNADHGQGCWNERRIQQSRALLAFVRRIQSEVGDPDVIVLGDLNSYLEEEPIKVLSAGGLLNPLVGIPKETRYSYVYRGEAGLLDYAFVTPSLRVAGVTIWHINSDEPRILDYNTEYNPAALYRPDAFRSSDHDPVLLGVDFGHAP